MGASVVCGGHQAISPLPPSAAATRRAVRAADPATGSPQLPSRDGADPMVKISIELEGGADAVVQALRRISGDVPGVLPPGAGAVPPVPPERVSPESSAPEPTPPTAELSSGGWTEMLAAAYLAQLDPEAREVVGLAWRAGAAGIHRNALRQRTGLTPEQVRPLLLRMGHRLRRFQRERSLALPRPVQANSPLQTYFIDPGFAAAASAPMFRYDR